MEEIVEQNGQNETEMDENEEEEESTLATLADTCEITCHIQSDLVSDGLEQVSGEENVNLEPDSEDDPPYQEDSPSHRRQSYKKCLKREAKAGGKHTFYYVQKFRKEWLEIEEFRDWIEEVPGDVTKVRCSWCQRILNARLNDLKRHVKTKKHMVLCDQVVAGLGYVKVTPVKSRNTTENADCSRSQLLNILRDISAMEENNTNGDEPTAHLSYEEEEEEPEYETSFGSADMSKVVKEHSEMNKLLLSIINIQKERLSQEQERLEVEKKQVVLQRELVHVLDEKLTTLSTPSQ